jgi:hypothetical protein
MVAMMARLLQNLSGTLIWFFTSAFRRATPRDLYDRFGAIAVIRILYWNGRYLPEIDVE